MTATLLSACGGDPAPAPDTATQTPAAATQAPAATPSPASTPARSPTATPEQAQAARPAASMRGLVVDTSTTGKDLLDRLSEEEVACIKTAYGDAVFQFIRQSPVLARGATPPRRRRCSSA